MGNATILGNVEAIQSGIKYVSFRIPNKRPSRTVVKKLMAKITAEKIITGYKLSSSDRLMELATPE